MLIPCGVGTWIVLGVSQVHKWRNISLYQESVGVGYGGFLLPRLWIYLWSFSQESFSVPKLGGVPEFMVGNSSTVQMVVCISGNTERRRTTTIF